MPRNLDVVPMNSFLFQTRTGWGVEWTVEICWLTAHLFCEPNYGVDYCPKLEEEDVTKKAFELLFAFDEVINLGYRDSTTLEQARRFIFLAPSLPFQSLILQIGSSSSISCPNEKRSFPLSHLYSMAHCVICFVLLLFCWLKLKSPPAHHIFSSCNKILFLQCPLSLQRVM